MQYANKLNVLMIRKAYIPLFVALSNEDAGIIIKTLFFDFDNMERDPIQDQRLQTIYDLIVAEIDDSAEKYLQDHPARSEGTRSPRRASPGTTRTGAPPGGQRAAAGLVEDPGLCSKQ